MIVITEDLSHSETNSVYSSDLGFYSLIVITEDLSHSETNSVYRSDLGSYFLIVITEYFLKLFGTLIMSILIYRCEIWISDFKIDLLDNSYQLEKVHITNCK